MLAPTLAEFAAPDLAREEIPKLLSGDAMWCQGFSEPGTGSDLSSLSCRATPRVEDRNAPHLPWPIDPKLEPSIDLCTAPGARSISLARIDDRGRSGAAG